MKKRILFIISFLILLLFIVGCGSSKSSDTSRAEDSVESNDMDFGLEEDGESLNKAQNDFIDNESKIIKTASIELETKTFDDTKKALIEKTKEIGGYVESSNIYGSSMYEENSSRNASYTFRIPKEYYSDFLNTLGNLGHVRNLNESGENVTMEYYDTEAHLKTLKIEEERILALLEKSDNLTDIIQLEDKLSDIRYQIESLTSTLKNIDNKVDYTTFNINIYESKEYTIAPSSLGQRLSSAFVSSGKSLVILFKGILIFIAALIPYLVIIIPICFIVYHLIKKRDKIKNK
ncbi:MAG: DUF4349 domain-containing protein [Clostridiaceae bacterium]